ncbi:MAG: hypothetical protein V4717_14780 [Bacteroidota bacterium]
MGKINSLPLFEACIQQPTLNTYICKVKKIVIILVLLVYSSTTIGATVHLHYCMNEFAGWDLFHDEKDNACGKCGMKEKKGGCCKDEHQQIKIDDDHQKSTVTKHIQLIVSPALLTLFAAYIFKPTALPYYTPFSNAPPLIPKRLHLLHCVFLI